MAPEAAVGTMHLPWDPRYVILEVVALRGFYLINWMAERGLAACKVR